MFQFLLSGPFVPFSIALGLLCGLLAMELVALALGNSVLASDADGPDLAPDAAEFDLDPGTEPDIPALLTAPAALDVAANSSPSPSGGGGLAALLGLGQAPFMIWLAAVLTGFGISGLTLQSIATSVVSAPVPLVLALPLAAAAGLGFGRSFAGLLSRLIPRIETTATRAQFMGGLRGVVTQGVARDGSPAEVRLRDRHGNIHYVRCEPFRDTDIIPEGTEVLTLRERLGPDRWGLRILPLP